MQISKLMPAALVLTVLVPGCARRVETVSAPPTGGIGPTLVVEQFLSAVNANDLMKMGNLFGTRDGPLNKLEKKELVEQRMFIFANVLRHDDYKIEGEQIVPGRMREATQLDVSLTTKGKKVTVPFTLVRSKGDSWLIEKFDMEKILYPR